MSVLILIFCVLRDRSSITGGGGATKNYRLGGKLGGELAQW